MGECEVSREVKDAFESLAEGRLSLHKVYYLANLPNPYDSSEKALWPSWKSHLLA